METSCGTCKKGEIGNGKKMYYAEVHSECLTGDTFGSLRCDCGQQLAVAMTKIENEGKRSSSLYASRRKRYRAYKANFVPMNFKNKEWIH